MINPILDWSEDEVWEFLHHYGCAGNPLYQCGKKRIGCIGCPLSGNVQMKSDFIKYPAFKNLYLSAFDKMLIEREKSGKENYSWTDGESVMKWWLQCDTDQLVFDGFDIMEFVTPPNQPTINFKGEGSITTLPETESEIRAKIDENGVII